MFPQNIIDLLVANLVNVSGITHAFPRELNKDDPNGAAGVCFELWTPHVEKGIAVEIGGGFQDPTLGDYHLNIEHLVKNNSREAGAAQHYLVARNIRSMLYRDPSVQVAFRSLVHQGANFRERAMKWSLEQRFVDNKISATYYFVSVTKFVFTTETV
jgi:hypothetical protein